MNGPSEQELIDLLEKCWNAATKARISNGPMLFERKDESGRAYIDTLRVNTFHNLVGNLLNKTVTPREPWEAE